MEDIPIIAIYDVRGIQDYVFRTNALKEIVGASLIVDNLIINEFKNAVLKQKIEDSAIILDWQNTNELKFKVLEDAKNSDLNLLVTDYGDSDLNQFKYEVENGKVTILNNVVVGDSENLNPSQEENVTWESSDNTKATIDEFGNVTFKDTGEVTINKKNNKGKIIDSKIYNIKDKEIKEVKIAKPKEEDANNNLQIIIIISLFILLIGSIFIIRLLKRRRIAKN